MLAGRKLLLADDSITIQKVVALTFADEGVDVLTVSDGEEAIAKLQEVSPDVVLADVYMPKVSGYEVCEYVKQNAKLRHIPVMLLVGSFEPFDEAEARRVGADDILTKPFQSIRRLIEKVGGLVTAKPETDEVSTADLPKVEEGSAEGKLTTDELQVTTADTQPLPISERELVEPAYMTASALPPQNLTVDTSREDHEKESPSSELLNESALDQGDDVPLDLGDIGLTSVASADDFVLDLDLHEAEASWDAPSARTHAFVEPQLSQPGVVDWELKSEPSQKAYASASLIDSQFAATQECMPGEPARPSDSVSGPGRYDVRATPLERVVDEPGEERRDTTPTRQVSLDQLSPEVIDAIARRAVEHLSERVVQEIAWEVVPQLAELLIKRKLDEKASQPK